MHKAVFSGITVLDAGDSLTDSGAAFAGQDRQIIDRLLEVGAVTHRHDAHPALADPLVAPSAAVTASGGAIPGDRTIYVGFTLIDSSGGETLLSDTEIVTTPAQYDAPTSAPEASADYTAGTLLAGTYAYGITFTDGVGGETPIGPAVFVTRDPGYASGRVLLAGMAGFVADAGAAGWRLYRAQGGGEFDFLAEGTADTFTDTGSIPLNCAVHPPSLVANTTVGANLLTVVVPSGSAGVSSGAAQFRLFLSEDGLFEDPCLYGTYPPSSAGVPIVIPSLLLLRGQPPIVSNAHRGANKIDPDTELIDWHWKRPVATTGDLPPAASGAVEGDVRVVTADGLPRRFHASAWGLWALGAATITAQGSAGVGAIRLVGSGEVGVSAATTSAGETTWTIYAPSGGVGGGGGGGASGITVHYGKVAYSDVTDLEWAPDGGAVQVNVSGGFATVINKPSGRTETGIGPYTLASGASAAGGTNFAPGFRLLRVSVDRACRVRIYMNTTDQTADAGRAMGTDPTGDHGVVWEHVFSAGDLVRRLSPEVFWSSQGTPTTPFVGDDAAPGGPNETYVPITVTNLGSTGDVSVTLVWQQVEAYNP